MAFDFEFSIKNKDMIFLNGEHFIPDWNSSVGRWIVNDVKDKKIKQSNNTWSKDGEPDPGNDKKYRFPLTNLFLEKEFTFIHYPVYFCFM